MFDAKKTAEEMFTVTTHGELSHTVEFCGEHEDEFSDLADAQAYVAYRVEQMVKFAKKAKAEGIAEGRKQAVTVVSGMADQAAAAAKKFERSRNDAMLMIYSAVRDALKATVNTIESLPLEPQPLETKGTDNA